MNQDKYLFIVNPTSGKGRGEKYINTIENFCDSNSIKYSIKKTKYPKHATELVKSNLNYNSIISVGGDGTLNEVVNGIDSTEDQVPILGVLPTGTGNDFVKNIGLNANLKDTLSILTNKKLHSILEVDICEIEYLEYHDSKAKFHLFINNCGIGFDAYVGYLNRKNKYVSGVSSYIYAVIKALFNFKMIDIETIVNNNIINGKKLMVTIGNGISSGGGFYLTPDAIINDGLFDISFFEEVNRRRLLQALPLALFNKIKRVPEASFDLANKVSFRLKDPYFVHCDGEIISNKLASGKIRIRNNKLKVIVNKGIANVHEKTYT